LILAAFVIITLSRVLVIALVSLLLRGTRESISWRWSAALAWGGLRGGLTMVLALSLPPTFPGRDLIVALTYGVVVLSILVQGLSMRRLLRRLRVTEEQPKVGELARAQLDLLTIERVRVMDSFKRGQISAAVYEQLLADIDARWNRAELAEIDARWRAGH
jgi:CPA1 family monovalent cation:H+ antiporter